jgi:hypothetical protein
VRAAVTLWARDPLVLTRIDVDEEDISRVLRNLDKPAKLETSRVPVSDGAEHCFRAPQAFLALTPFPVLLRVREFLPKLKEETKKLEEKLATGELKPEDVNIEHMSDDEEQHIEMVRHVRKPTAYFPNRIMILATLGSRSCRTCTAV